MRGLIGSILLVLTSTASANPALHAPRTAKLYDFVAESNADGIVSARRLLPANHVTAVLAESRIIYLNHTGASLRPGDDDSRTGTSSIVSSQVHVPAWNTSAQTWAATVACFRDL